MTTNDQKLKQAGATPAGTSASAERQAALAEEQGRYGSGGSYGVGGGFDDDEGRDSAPDERDGRAARAARSGAQQDGEQSQGFEREVDPDAAPREPHRDAARSPDEAQLAAKNRRGSRI